MAHIEDGFARRSFTCSDVKKNIFLIGDSIRQGYCEVVREELADSAEVFFVKDNCRNTQYVISNLRKWANMFDRPERVDLVQFNCGHWDIAHWCGGEDSLTSRGEYARNMYVIIDMLTLLFPNAKIVCATTTTMNPDGTQSENVRSNWEISRYNGVIRAVAADKELPVNDLFALTVGWEASFYKDYCHFTQEAYVLLGKEVARFLRLYL